MFSKHHVLLCSTLLFMVAFGFKGGFKCEKEDAVRPELREIRPDGTACPQQALWFCVEAACVDPACMSDEDCAKGEVCCANCCNIHVCRPALTNAKRKGDCPPTADISCPMIADIGSCRFDEDCVHCKECKCCPTDDHDDPRCAFRTWCVKPVIPGGGEQDVIVEEEVAVQEDPLLADSPLIVEDEGVMVEEGP